MTTVCHLLDASIDWEQRLALSAMLDRLARDRFRQVVAAIDPAGAIRARRWGLSVELLHAPLPVSILSAPSVRRFAERNWIDLIHAWGLRAAMAGRAGGTDRPVLLQMFDPGLVAPHHKALRALTHSPRFGVVCSSGIVQRRLIERGVPLEQCVVIRPGIDFSTINRRRRIDLRETLGVPRDHMLIVTAPPMTRCSGAFEAFSAAALINHLSGSIRMIVPGDSREARRIARFAAGLPSRPTLISTGYAHDLDALIAASDVFLTAPHGDVSATAIAFAMAANVAVIASAVPSIAELIAHKVNGLLFKPPPRQGAVVDIVQRLQDRDAQGRLKEAAHGQAYEAFSMRRFVEQQARVYENMLAAAPPADGVVDSAISA